MRIFRNPSLVRCHWTIRPFSSLKIFIEDKPQRIIQITAKSTFLPKSKNDIWLELIRCVRWVQLYCIEVQKIGLCITSNNSSRSLIRKQSIVTSPSLKPPSPENFQRQKQSSSLIRSSLDWPRSLLMAKRSNRSNTNEALSVPPRLLSTTTATILVLRWRTITTSKPNCKRISRQKFSPKLGSRRRRGRSFCRSLRAIWSVAIRNR